MREINALRLITTTLDDVDMLLQGTHEKNKTGS